MLALNESMPFFFEKDQLSFKFLWMSSGQQMSKAGFVSHRGIGPEHRNDDAAAAGRIERSKAFVGGEDYPFIPTSDPIDCGIFKPVPFEFFDIQDVMARFPEHAGGGGRDALVDEEAHAQALSLKRAGAVTESFCDIFGCEMGKLAQNVLDRVAVGQVVKDQGNGDPSPLDDRLTVQDQLVANDSRKGLCLTISS